MAEEAQADYVESVSVVLMPSFNYSRNHVTVSVFDHVMKNNRLYESFVFSSLGEATTFAEGALWAWSTTGLLGLTGFLDSREPERAL